MARIYLTSLASDVAGYKLALVDMRNPAGTALVTSVTATTSSGDNIAATETSGGTALKWITKPFLADVAVSAGLVFCNIWAVEASAAANASVGVVLAEYTTSDTTEQAAFLDFNYATELTTSVARTVFMTTAPTPTTVDAGNRLVVKFQAVAVGTMAVSTITVDYDGPTEGADGDTFITINEPIRVNEAQLGSGTVPPVPGYGQGFYQTIIDGVEALVGAKAISYNQSVRSLVDDCGFQRDNL